MDTSRLEIFSDGVLAIIITIMVLELKVPSGHNLSDLRQTLPIFLAYLLSFQVIGIYWNNHHHLFHATKNISSKIMWANLNLLFWLSLIPFATGWLGENYSYSWPTALYGILQLLCGFSFQILLLAVVSHKNNLKLGERIGNNLKGKLSLLGYVLSVCLAFVNPLFSDILFLLIAIVWFIPDSRLATEMN